MKAAVLVEDLFDERELVYPYYRLRELGFEVDLVGPELREYRGKSGLAVKATRDARSALQEDYIVLWIPGGYAPDRLRRSRDVLEPRQEGGWEGCGGCGVSRPVGSHLRRPGEG